MTYYIRLYWPLFFSDPSASASHTGSLLSALSNLLVVLHKRRLLSFVFYEQRHENGINVCLVQRLITLLLPFDLVAHILITRWSVVAWKLLLETCFLVFLGLNHHLYVFSQKQMKGRLLCARFTMAIKNYREMINNFLARFPVTWLIFCSVSRAEVLSERERKKQLWMSGMRGRTQHRHTTGAVFFGADQAC